MSSLVTNLPQNYNSTQKWKNLLTWYSRYIDDADAEIQLCDSEWKKLHSKQKFMKKLFKFYSFHSWHYQLSRNITSPWYFPDEKESRFCSFLHYTKHVTCLKRNLKRTITLKIYKLKKKQWKSSSEFIQCGQERNVCRTGLLYRINICILDLTNQGHILKMMLTTTPTKFILQRF